MADEAETDSPAPGGAAVGAPADDDASLLAELEADQGAAGGGKPAAKPSKAAKSAPVDDDADDGDVADDATPSDDPADDVEDDDDGEPTEDPDDEDDALAAAAAKDPELAKRLAAVRRTEQRQREQLTRDRAAFDGERAQWKSQQQGSTDGQKRYEALVSRAKLDPAGVLAELGVSDDDMEYAATQAYARSKKAAANPAYRAAAEQAQRQREAAEKTAANEKRIADLEAKLTERDQQAAVQRELDTYFGRALRKVDDTTPRTKKLIATNPKLARAELAATALELVEKGKKSLPEIKAKELLAAHEKKIARRLRMYGVEDAAAPAADDAAKSATKKPAAAAKSNGKPGAKPADAAADTDADETVIPSAADLVRELQSAQRN
jgi:hypothetical protein